ncbi:hypothetical protein DYBT9275_03117 [Dyadobacter sp. CECT 9275]|uniref:Alpha-galactosidase n=1 Tax=Dyadobacter helix TaxID=2822344 RepID=A0A916JCV2_9BACT|nr:hypothetical protein [Dyadobacter sp. CECT 9275]CAG5003273.1 hypothetical protein DYBT9275_03117 [Dyadobacter sp. CECT 9275]
MLERLSFAAIRNWLPIFCLLLSITKGTGQPVTKVYPGADEKTPSMAMYFDWINRNWYGSNEHKVLKALDFFSWMKAQYGMQMDVFLLDAGMFDNGPSCSSVPGRPAYGSLDSPWFTKAFPNGFHSIYQKATASGTRLGLWIGPDGYGDTADEAQKRVDLLVKLCTDFNLKVLKLDACSSDLRPEKEKYFIEAMRRARQSVPDLIVLNHRISLSPEAKKHTTTFLWEGKETYIDVNNFNEATAIHHRQGNMQRGYPPKLARLTEDHGICLSSALDFWEDDLILQAFNRSLILAPEIYGNPWLLKDEEFPTLARIYNLHRKYRDILVNGTALPEARYGYKAVSRGDSLTRFITLRNNSWDSKTFQLLADTSIGLGRAQRVIVKQVHPTEKVIGEYAFGDQVAVNVQPFRSALFMVSSENKDLSVRGVDYRITEDVAGKPVRIQLLGKPGTTRTVKVNPAERHFKGAKLDGKPADAILKGTKVTFPGTVSTAPFHRKLGNLHKTTSPTTSQVMFYESMCFANDNNALEVRSLQRAGKTSFPEVQAARDAFFEDSLFVATGSWDKFAFDGDTTTYFNAYASIYTKGAIQPGALRLDLGKPTNCDQILLRNIPQSYETGEILFSNDLAKWQAAAARRIAHHLVITIPEGQSCRYIKITKAPLSVSEIEVFYKNQKLKNNNLKASNLFHSERVAAHSWTGSFTVTRADSGSYLALAIPGKYKTEDLFAGIMSGMDLIAPKDRSPSFPYNNWEHVDTSNGNVTFYFPLNASMRNKPLKITLFSADPAQVALQPEVWVTAYPEPFVKKELVLD